MDVLYRYRDQTFIWDGRKALENKAKHGIAFETACEAFFDPYSDFVAASAGAENRMALIGMPRQKKLLYVVHVERGADQVRIISARLATAHERSGYEDGC